jgi:hypothetical protein
MVRQSAEQGFPEVLGEIPAFCEGAHTQRIAERGQHRNALANVLGCRAVHHGVEPGFHLPRALARRDHERGAAEARHSRLERGQRAQRRIKEHHSQDLAGECPRLGFVLQRLRQRQQVEHLLTAEIGKAQETPHAGIFDKASLSRST